MKSTSSCIGRALALALAPSLATFATPLKNLTYKLSRIFENVSHQEIKSSLVLALGAEPGQVWCTPGFGVSAKTPLCGTCVDGIGSSNKAITLV